MALFFVLFLKIKQNYIFSLKEKNYTLTLPKLIVEYKSFMIIFHFLFLLYILLITAY